MENEALKESIKEIFYEFKERYGSPRISIVLNRRSITSSKNIVARYIKEMNLKAKSYNKETSLLSKIFRNFFMEI